jgi:hypothetical protein
MTNKRGQTMIKKFPAISFTFSSDKDDNEFVLKLDEIELSDVLWMLRSDPTADLVETLDAYFNVRFQHSKLVKMVKMEKQIINEGYNPKTREA